MWEMIDFLFQFSLRVSKSANVRVACVIIMPLLIAYWVQKFCFLRLAFRYVDRCLFCLILISFRRWTSSH
jgi:hypothetical protein